MTLPSFFAASINCGVIAVAGGAAARAGAANTVPAASAEAPLSASRRVMIGFIVVSLVGVDGGTVVRGIRWISR
jgi:hypothetical protein